MKRLIFLLMIVCIVVPVFAADKPNPVISVTGIGEIITVPDEVTIRLVVQTDSKELDKAKKENDKLASILIRVVKKKGVNKKDIQTGQITINPRYSKTSVEKGFAGYFVRKNIVVKIRDIDKFEDILAELVTMGSDRISGIEFDSSERKKLEKKARLLAIKDAKQIANEVAGEIRQSIGKAVRINVNRISNGSPRMEMMAVRSMGNADSSFEPGEIKISAEVHAEFLLK